MQKTMNKARSDSLLNFDPNAAGESNMLQAKVLFEDTKEMLAQEPQKLGTVIEILYQWEAAIFAVFDETRRILATNKELEARKNELYNCLMLLKKQQRKYEQLKTERDNFTKYRNSLEAKSSLLNELYELLTTEEEHWKGLKEWESALELIIRRQESLVGDSLLAAGILTYLGAFSWRSRSLIKKQWQKTFAEAGLKAQERPKVGLLLGNAKQLADWHEKQLLVDDTTIENAFIKEHWRKWPLVIDPEGAATKWLCGKSGLKDTDRYFREELAKRMGQGKHLVIHLSNERIPREVLKMLELPVERTENIKINLSAEHIIVEGLVDRYKSDPNIIELHSKFAFTICIEHSKPVFPNYVYEMANVINFALSPKALEDNFMIEYGTYAGSSDFADAVLKKKNPAEWDKEKEEDSLLAKVKELQLDRIDEEDQRKLKDAIGDTMKRVTELKRRISETAEEKTKEVNEKIQTAFPLVSKASVMYQCISRLPSMKPNYLFTYQLVRELFIKELRDNSEVIAEAQMNMGQLKSRLKNIEEYLISDVMIALKQVMFRRDFLKFALYLAAKLAIQEKTITKEEWQIILHGENYQPAESSVNIVKNPVPDKITRGAWNLLGHLEKTLPDLYKGLSQDMIKNIADWEKWASNLAPHTAPLPALIQSLKPLQILLLVRLVCPEKFMTTLNWAASSVIGEGYLKKEPPKIAELFKKQTKVNKPLLVLVDGEEDATEEVMRLVHEEVKLESWCLAKETEAGIKRTLEECKRGFDKEEQWYFIKNIELIPGFGRYLVERLKEMSIAAEEDRSSSDSNDRWFRLILTSHTCRLPRELLLTSVRAVLDSPVTMKQRIARDLSHYQRQEETMLEVPANKDRYTISYRRLVLSLSLLHCVLSRRSRFPSNGWSSPFTLNAGDLELGANISFNLVNTFKENEPWEGLRHLMGDIWLGGGLEDEYDKEIVGCFVRRHFNDEVTKGNYAFVEDCFYQVPAQSNFEGMAKFIQSQPNEEACVLCGADAVETLLVERSEIEGALEPLKRVEFAKNKKAEITRKTEENFVESLFKEIPEVGFTKNDISPVIYEGKNKLPYAHNMFLLQEMSRYNALIERIHSSTAKIAHFLRTGKPMPHSLEVIYASLAVGQVPEEFTGYPWNHPVGEWVRNFKARLEYVLNWLKKGETKTYWLRAFIYPKGLLSSLLIASSQKSGEEIESIALAMQLTPYTKLEDIPEPNPHAYYLNGLYMVNAKYNEETKALDDINEEVKGVKCKELPLVLAVATAEEKEKTEAFECPVYYLPKRMSKVGKFENALMKVECPTSAAKDYWIMKQTFISCTNPELNS